VRSRRNGSRVAIALWLAVVFAGCVGDGTAPRPTSPAPQPHPPGSVQVRLVFGEQADLDLYVTDPNLETVYFGNNPSRGGGVLTADVRCDAATPRSEAVSFMDACPGRYRVGVEHASNCTRRSGPVPYRVEVLAGESEWQVEGEIEPGAFDNQVLEFELRTSAAPPIDAGDLDGPAHCVQAPVGEIDRNRVVLGHRASLDPIIPVQSFGVFPYPTRMAAARLEDGNLWVWSPIALDDTLAAELDAIGPARERVAPNKLHHLALPEWLARYPEARLHGAPGPTRKRRNFAFHSGQGDTPDPAWVDQIDQAGFRGSVILDHGTEARRRGLRWLGPER